MLTAHCSFNLRFTAYSYEPAKAQTQGIEAKKEMGHKYNEAQLHRLTSTHTLIARRGASSWWWLLYFMDWSEKNICDDFSIDAVRGSHATIVPAEQSLISPEFSTFSRFSAGQRSKSWSIKRHEICSSTENEEAGSHVAEKK